MLIPIKLSDANGVPTRVQLLRVGNFKAPEGDLSITPIMLASFKKNFDQKVRGYDDGKLPIDYFHENDKVAAGWIENLELTNDGSELWADVSWTTNAKQKLAEKELRYISAEFSFDFQPNESSERFGPTLFGAGLTNRPFVKGMMPITLDELKKKEEKPKKASDGGMMDLEQALAKIKELEAQLAALTKKDGDVSAEMGDLQKKVAQYAEEKVLAEKRDSFNKMLAEGKVVEAQREPYVAGDMVKFSELAKPTNMGGSGSNGTGAPDDGKSYDVKIRELAEVVMKEKKCSLTQAFSEVLGANKELRTQYEKAMSLR